MAAGRGGHFLFSSAAADADADAAAAVRETEPSMGPQPLKRVHSLTAGARSPHLRMGGSTRRYDARSRQPVAHKRNNGFLHEPMRFM